MNMPRMPVVAIPPKAAQQDYRHRCIDSTAEHQRLEHVVGGSGDDQEHTITDRGDGAVVSTVPNETDCGQGDQERRKLSYSKHQHNQRQYHDKQVS